VFSKIGCGVLGLGFRVLGNRVWCQGPGFRGFGFGVDHGAEDERGEHVWGLGCRVYGVGLRGVEIAAVVRARIRTWLPKCLGCRVWGIGVDHGAEDERREHDRRQQVHVPGVRFRE